MRIKTLKLKNIGPFKNADIEFIENDTELDSPPVIFITGENGTGKSVVIDAIRALLNGRFSSGKIERDITSSDDFLIDALINVNENERHLRSTRKFNDRDDCLETNDLELNKVFISTVQSTLRKDFIFDYWTSKLSNDSFEISNITALNPKEYLNQSLSGVHRNVDLIKNITFFDYLKDSRNDSEKELGESLYRILELIINLSILDGNLSHVSRINLKPIVKVNNSEITLDKLSSGNLYLIQRFVNLLNQVYSICIMNNIQISDYQSIKGVLIIDEAENHLHPKWQKVFLNNVLELFPKLQIIVSTHSPFIISSISNSRVYVCSNKIDHSEIKEETDFYSNKPIEEILLSPLFNTRNFNSTITKLLDLRKVASENNDVEKVKEIEQELIQINPEYFDYLKLDEILNSIKK